MQCRTGIKTHFCAINNKILQSTRENHTTQCTCVYSFWFLVRLNSENIKRIDRLFGFHFAYTHPADSHNIYWPRSICSKLIDKMKIIRSVLCKHLSETDWIYQLVCFSLLLLLFLFFKINHLYTNTRIVYFDFDFHNNKTVLNTLKSSPSVRIYFNIIY